MMETRLHAQPRGAPLPSVALVRGGVLQRKCACGGSAGVTGECDACSKQNLSLQRSTLNSEPETRNAELGTRNSGGVPPIVHEVLNSPGQPLDGETRAFFEPRFGHDFSRVRVHADVRAAESAGAVNARAYTVGRDLVFGAAQYQPGSTAGNELLAHELTHVVQQEGFRALQGQLMIGPASDGFEQEADHVAHQITRGQKATVEELQPAFSVNVIQRDLSTPLPAVPAQPALTPQQIQEAIAFNRARYDRANTLLIQNLLGGDITGVWNEGNIEAIANTQEQFGLTKDGMVGFDTFRFLNEEARLEPLGTTTANCLTSFLVIGPDAATFARTSPNTCQMNGHFRTQSQFSARCNCSEFQYRQFIRGHFRRERGGVVTDLSGDFNFEPAGALTAAFQEDGDVNDVPVFYGHRNQPADAAPEDHYLNDGLADDQAHGCRYRNEDTPGGPINDCQPGDIFDADVNFRGEIQRNGAPIETKFWTGIRNRFVAPP